jgi:hypothetical protein
MFTLHVIWEIWNPRHWRREINTPRFTCGHWLHNIVGNYGEVLKTDNPSNGIRVNRWMLTGGASTVIYGIALLLNGLFSVHSTDVHILASLSSVMTLSSCAAGVAALAVYGFLSPVARQIAGPWVHTLAISKFLLAVCSFVLLMLNMLPMRSNTTQKGACIAYYIWQWASLMALPLQCLSGASLWRIRVRAGVAGGVASLCLVAGSFCAGFGMWSAGFLFDRWEKSVFVGMVIGPCYTLAAVGHLIAGVGLVIVNKEVKESAAVELVDDPESATVMGRTSEGILRYRGGPAREENPTLLGRRSCPRDGPYKLKQALGA